MRDFPTIEDDKREILAIWYPGENAGGYTTNSKVGPTYHCDKIVAYGENGHMASIPFFAVFRNGGIYVRVPANLVEVTYNIGGDA